jgi:peroxiredoxin
MKTRVLVIVLIGLAVLVVSSVLLADLSPGTKAPSFTLPTLDGKTFTLKQPGKVVVMDIWATWCPPCRAEIPYVIRLSKKYAGKDVVIVGVSVDQRKGDVSGFAKDKGVNYTIALDPGGQTLGGPYQLRGIPATYIIDKKGVIRYVHSGFGGASDAEKMDREVAMLLAK